MIRIPVILTVLTARIVLINRETSSWSRRSDGVMGIYSPCWTDLTANFVAEGVRIGLDRHAISTVPVGQREFCRPRGRSALIGTALQATARRGSGFSRGRASRPYHSPETRDSFCLGHEAVVLT